MQCASVRAFTCRCDCCEWVSRVGVQMQKDDCKRLHNKACYTPPPQQRPQRCCPRRLSCCCLRWWAAASMRCPRPAAGPPPTAGLWHCRTGTGCGCALGTDHLRATQKEGACSTGRGSEAGWLHTDIGGPSCLCLELITDRTVISRVSLQHMLGCTAGYKNLSSACCSPM